jgi:RES domain-containing protein
VSIAFITPYSRNAFDGEGAYRFGGRWSSPGVRLAYTAEHLSLALLEYFVHIDPNDPPKDLVVGVADIPNSLTRRTIVPTELPVNWRATPAPPELAAIGDAFALDCRIAILMVPSVLAPAEANWLINLRHPHFTRIRAQQPAAFQYDPRFFQA